MAILLTEEIAYPCPHPSHDPICLFLLLCHDAPAPANSIDQSWLTSEIPYVSIAWRPLNLLYRPTNYLKVMQE